MANALFVIVIALPTVLFLLDNPLYTRDSGVDYQKYGDTLDKSTIFFCAGLISLI